MALTAHCPHFLFIKTLTKIGTCMPLSAHRQQASYILGQVCAALHMCLPFAPHADILAVPSSRQGELSQPCHVDAVPQEAPQPSLLSRLLNAPQQDLPDMLSQVFSPLTEPFARLPPLSELPINPGGSQSGWRYNGQALLEHHVQQAKQLPVGDVLPTGGLLGQPTPGRDCPAAPSVTRSKVRACTAIKQPVSLPSLLTSARPASEGTKRLL